jgi:Ni,Fe-hydrogenase III small subunit/formate hydrogenlyase subunit 6/NADH:ubiquinone oxidoreductase subunit I
MLRVIRDRLRRGTVTTAYPSHPEAAPPAFRGMPEIEPARCRGDSACAPACPTGAIEVSTGDDGGWTWRLDRAACVGCGACIDACPTGALTASPLYELAVRRREDLVSTYTFTRGAPPPAAPPAAGVPPESVLAGQLGARIARLFRRSLQIRHLDAGSSNAEDWELGALLGPVYDVQRLGIDFVASPRHADMLVVTGPVTRNLAAAVRATYDATPDPKLVVALGTDACSGGVVGQSYATAGGVDRWIPVDLYVPGDPPRPQAILHGLLVALDRREQKLHAETHRVGAVGRGFLTE